MLCRILTEDETTAQLRDQIITLTTAQLLYLEKTIQLEKQKRKQETFSEWLKYLGEVENRK